MALHPDFPKSPYDVLIPEYRWFPADEALREKGYEKLLPPLVAELRRKVKEFRDSNYEGATSTSKALLRWWFQTEHLLPTATGAMWSFQYYFAQREAIETIIYLHEVVNVKDKYDLLRFDASGTVSAGMFFETWRRYVIKMATGSGKTKVISLVLAWSYFHKLYEENSTLSRNFLVIAPNIIVLDRLRADFDGLKIFYQDPILPENGFDGRNWRDDFQLTLHIQDELGLVRKTGNFFLTNIHRVYEGDTHVSSFEDDDTTDYFLGKRPTGKTTDSKVDLDVIVRDIEELVVINDEAHHVHDEKLAWFKCIEDINNRLKMKGSELSLQIDVTATPKHNNGAIFVQTVSDYPLVEAIAQNVVKRPVLPDPASRAKLQERQSSKFTEKYQDYLHLGYLEWKNGFEEHKKLGKKAVLFVMTDDTKNCDEVAEYLETTYPEFKNAVLVIHTKNNGEISEASSGKNLEELKKLREAANSIDDEASPYKVIVSVLMLKEGWDVQNVTTIVGLRAYSSTSNILPEQTLGRGLRRMYRGADDVTEYVSVVGTDAFMDFVESIKSEGVELDRVKMGEGSKPKTPIIVEVDHENVKKDIESLDIKIPVLTPRIYREYKNLSDLKPNAFTNKRAKLTQYSKDEQEKDIVFKDITTDEITHITKFDSTLNPDFRSVVGFFAQTIMRELRLVSGYDVLYGQVKEFIQSYLFECQVEIEDLNVLRNLSELEARKTIVETFKKEINKLTVRDKGEAEIREYLKISKCRPFIVKDQGYIIPKKSIFNKIIGDSHLELEFAGFLEECPDIVSYVKNYLAVNFKIDYQDASGFISNYYPDFIVKVSERDIYIIETKGREDVDDKKKFVRLKQWCDDINRLQSDIHYSALYVGQEEFEKYKAKSFMELVRVIG
ncbi:MAG TPA: DEAD/DEAH box helicase family protein [Oligoflexia bacterium]|nr:DEAD/DEAH box helicase family protein [Oligoflexia bacterium]HMP49436.1 DEAD/DEAH box helicase family protein [Oligoflexia bacterium]